MILGGAVEERWSCGIKYGPLMNADAHGWWSERLE